MAQKTDPVFTDLTCGSDGELAVSDREQTSDGPTNKPTSSLTDTRPGGPTHTWHRGETEHGAAGAQNHAQRRGRLHSVWRRARSVLRHNCVTAGGMYCNVI